MLDKMPQGVTTRIDNDAARRDRSVEHDVVDLYEAPMWLWHWVNAAAILVLGVTGYFIGTGTAAMLGQPSNSLVFRYIRFVHFSAGYVLTVGFLLRIYLALVGNSHARQIFYVPLWRRCFWSELWHALRWYAFLAAKPEKHVGHNPLALLAMFFMFTLTSAFMIVTGFALYAQGSGNDSWQYQLFGWVFAIWPNSQDVHTWHHLGLWVIVCFALVHIYAVIWEAVVSRRSIRSSMISGEREFRG
ncbi:Ni/Fe hydrogenase 1 b-type cytochrome subunit [Bradyrhizobium macuxiense]|uniref:Ni/Fe hydrogenase 1 b-type cytochrome subunit n=1 Tax=Bradyrhizobium macuxiense TaxID=1755647 RepID=A0A109JZX2_9BRAD|nr:Ni/Fe-hydrogenase, b-type cytochrome subunit [Bradyrhizobium macuxiense]KWV58126.1 Ni/Fe hydrogenase 1 b-type cytochrome subunit [Bradyrhizobium macuxiense]